MVSPPAHSLHPGLCSNLKCHVIREPSLSKLAPHPPSLPGLFFFLAFSTQHHIFICCLSPATKALCSLRAGTLCSMLSPQHPGVCTLVLSPYQFARPATAKHHRSSTTERDSHSLEAKVMVWGGLVPSQVVREDLLQEALLVSGGQLAIFGCLVYNCITLISAVILTWCLLHVHV